MKVTLGPFACSSLESRFGGHASMAAGTAVRWYADRLESDVRPVDVPSFARNESAPGGSEGTELEFAVGPDIEATLIEEAQRCGVPLDRLVSHAVFVLLSDLEIAAPDRVNVTAAELTSEELATALRSGSDAWRLTPAYCEGRSAPPRRPLPRRDRDRRARDRSGRDGLGSSG